jgi:hypothetical protein
VLTAGAGDDQRTSALSSDSPSSRGTRSCPSEMVRTGSCVTLRGLGCGQQQIATMSAINREKTTVVATRIHVMTLIVHEQWAQSVSQLPQSYTLFVY